jgi:hypothetical protein
MHSTNKKTCSACASWFQQDDDKMTPLGYGRCPHLPVGEYVALRAVCLLPNQFKPRPKQPRAKS